ncbi:hypothetical protein, partial [Mameliella alba]|uniref:hypothetical protein n=2 Tax=Mameliella alba TaxID=561184 RepID=UPI001E5D7B17
EHRPAVPSGLPISASAPPVKGLLRLHTKTRKQFFGLSSSFFHERLKTTQNQWIERCEKSRLRR